MPSKALTIPSARYPLSLEFRTATTLTCFLLCSFLFFDISSRSGSLWRSCALSSFSCSPQSAVPHFFRLFGGDSWPLVLSADAAFGANVLSTFTRVNEFSQFRNVFRVQLRATNQRDVWSFTADISKPSSCPFPYLQTSGVRPPHLGALAAAGRVSVRASALWRYINVVPSPTDFLLSSGSTRVSAPMGPFGIEHGWNLHNAFVCRTALSSLVLSMHLGRCGNSVWINGPRMEFYTHGAITLGQNAAYRSTEFPQCSWEAARSDPSDTIRASGTGDTFTLAVRRPATVHQVFHLSELSANITAVVDSLAAFVAVGFNITAPGVVPSLAFVNAAGEPASIGLDGSISGPFFSKLRLPSGTRRVQLRFRFTSATAAVSRLDVRFTEGQPPTPSATASVSLTGTSALPHTRTATPTATHIATLTVTGPSTPSTTGPFSPSMTLAVTASRSNTPTRPPSATCSARSTATISNAVTSSHTTTLTQLLTVTPGLTLTPRWSRTSTSTISVTMSQTQLLTWTATADSSHSRTFSSSSDLPPTATTRHTASSSLPPPPIEEQRPEAVPAATRATVAATTTVAASVSAVVGSVGGGALALQRVAALAAFCEPFDPDDSPAVFEHPLRFAAGAGPARHPLGAALGASALAVTAATFVACAAVGIRLYRGPGWRPLDERPAAVAGDRTTAEFTFTAASALTVPLLDGDAYRDATPDADATADVEMQQRTTAGGSLQPREPSTAPKVSICPAILQPFLESLRSHADSASHYLSAARAGGVLLACFVVLGPMAIQPAVAAAVHGDAAQRAVSIAISGFVSIVPAAALVWCWPSVHRHCAMSSVAPVARTPCASSVLWRRLAHRFAGLWAWAWRPSGEWRCTKGQHAESSGAASALALYGAGFEAYRAPWHWFLVAETYAALAVSAVSAASTADVPWACVAAEVAAVVIASALLFVTAVLRPYLCPGDAILAVAGGVLEVTAAAMRAAGAESSAVEAVLLLFAAVALVQLCASMGRAVWRFVVRRRRHRRAQATNGGSAPPVELNSVSSSSHVRTEGSKQHADDEADSVFSFGLASLSFPEVPKDRSHSPPCFSDVGSVATSLPSPVDPLEGFTFDAVADSDLISPTPSLPPELVIREASAPSPVLRAVRASNSEYTARVEEIEALLNMRELT